MLECVVDDPVDQDSVLASGESPKVSQTGPALLSLLDMPWTQTAGWVASAFIKFLAARGLVYMYKEVTMSNSNSTSQSNLGLARRLFEIVVIPFMATLLVTWVTTVVEAAGGDGLRSRGRCIPCAPARVGEV